MDCPNRKTGSSSYENWVHSDDFGSEINILFVSCCKFIYA